MLYIIRKKHGYTKRITAETVILLYISFLLIILLLYALIGCAILNGIEVRKYPAVFTALNDASAERTFAKVHSIHYTAVPGEDFTKVFDVHFPFDQGCDKITDDRRSRAQNRKRKICGNGNKIFVK